MYQEMTAVKDQVVVSLTNQVTEGRCYTAAQICQYTVEPPASIHTRDQKSFRLKVLPSRFVHLENFILNFSSSSFPIRVNLLHPQSSSLLFGLFLPLWCLSTLAKYYFKVSCYLKGILCDPIS